MQKKVTLKAKLETINGKPQILETSEVLLELVSNNNFSLAEMEAVKPLRDKIEVEFKKVLAILKTENGQKNILETEREIVLSEDEFNIIKNLLSRAKFPFFSTIFLDLGNQFEITKTKN